MEMNCLEEFEGCACFVSFDIVCYDLSDGVKYVGVYEFVNELYIHTV